MKASVGCNEQKRSQNIDRNRQASPALTYPKTRPGKLAAIKIIECRDVDYETAKKEVMGYFGRVCVQLKDINTIPVDLNFGSSGDI
jgi:hypothetical protein